MYAVLIPCFTIPLQVIDFLPGSYDLQTTLPLQLCDLAWIAAVVALWTHRPHPGRPHLLLGARRSPPRR